MSLTSLTVSLRRAPSWTVPAAAAATATFLALALLVIAGLTREIDLATIRAFQSIASYPLDVAVNAHTVIGQLAITLPVSLALAYLAQRRLGGYAWLGPLLILATGGVELVFKNIASHAGPPLEFVRAFGNTLGIPRELHPPFSFPSGHVARLSFLTLTVVWLFPSRLSWIAGAAFVAFSLFARVYVGDHWITDALAGLSLGTGAGAVAIAWMRTMGRR